MLEEVRRDWRRDRESPATLFVLHDTVARMIDRIVGWLIDCHVGWSREIMSWVVNNKPCFDSFPATFLSHARDTKSIRICRHLSLGLIFIQLTLLIYIAVYAYTRFPDP